MTDGAMTGAANGVDESLLRPARLWTRDEVLARPSSVPPEAGVYAWYFRIPPGGAPVDHVHHGLALLYVGISPANRPASRQHLRSRIRYHYRGNASGSTLRLSIGVLLGIPLRRVGSGLRMTFTPTGEGELSTWMATNALVCWHAIERPWEAEERLISQLNLPLNLDANQRHGFHATLTSMRRDARTRARALPVRPVGGRPPETSFSLDRGGLTKGVAILRHKMPLFEVDPATQRVTEVQPTTFPDLKLWERQHLEAWVTSAPELAGGEFTVVTSEFDRFDRTSERLDVLGLVRIEPAHGRLVVVELKRDGSSTTLDLQAIKYAAYVAAAEFAEIVEMYARHHHVGEEQARATLLELLGGSDDEPPIIDTTPRIVLVAGDFRPEVTTTVLWLIDNFDLDIRCVRLQPFAVDERILVHSEVIIPLPEAEKSRLGVQRKRREVERVAEERSRGGRLLPQLVEHGALHPGRDTLLPARRSAIRRCHAVEPHRAAIPGDAREWRRQPHAGVDEPRNRGEGAGFALAPCGAPATSPRRALRGSVECRNQRHALLDRRR